MIKKLKKFLTDTLRCRMKKSSFTIIVFAVIFIFGNYILFMNFYKKGNIQVNTSGTKQTVHEKTLEKAKYSTSEELFAKKFKKYEEQKEIKIEDHQDNVVAVKKDEPHKNSELSFKDNSFKMALLVIACNRPSVGRCLDRIFKYKPKDVEIPIIVSQDCGHEATANVIKSYGEKVMHIQQPDLGPVKNVPHNMHRFMGYYKISRHFKFALGKVFEDWTIDSVVIVEDDIDIAPDFFDYFLATRPLLEKDKSLYCVSAWNDNGKSDAIDEDAIDTLYRSDFFPGLGWLITRELWQEIGPNWPLGFWDDWMRAPEQRKNRACIRPEISRTKTFGRIGVSQGQFYDQYLKYIKLNTKPYPFRDFSLDNLVKENYNKNFVELVYNSPEKQIGDVMSNSERSEEPIRLTYRNNNEFAMLARKFGLMSDLKAGVPRTAYKGVVTLYRNGRRIYIAPPSDWKEYSEH